MDILLAIGDITVAHCEPIMQKMRELGMDPQLVLLDAPLNTEGDFLDAAQKCVPYGLPSERVTSYIEDWIEQKKRNIIRDAFSFANLVDVKAVIRLATSGPAYLDWLMERLPATHAEHLIYVGDNGERWIEGDYGHLELLTTD